MLTTLAFISIALFSHVMQCEESRGNFAKGELTSSARNFLKPNHSTDADVCAMNVTWPSVLYFKSRLKLTDHPQLIKIRLGFLNRSFNETAETFRGNHWIWTYKPPSGSFPYLSLSVDFGVLSFGMLDERVFDVYIDLDVDTRCNITLGTPRITNAIGEALLALNSNLGYNGTAISKYIDSFYCFLAEAPGIRDTLEYKAALYLTFPINYLNYNCCTTQFSFEKDSFDVNCSHQQYVKLSQCTLWPFIMSVVLFLYSPMVLWRIINWTDGHDTGYHNELEIDSLSVNPGGPGSESRHRDWVYLDGDSPYSFSHLLANLWFGYDKTHPVYVSKIKRFMILIFMPTGLYIQLITYYHGPLPKELIVESIKHRDPIGFLALIGRGSVDISQSFAPALGGPVWVLVMYYVIGLVILVFPSSLKKIITDGMPKESSTFRSPLCLGNEEIQVLSKLHCKTTPVASVCTNSFVMLFSDVFWKEVFAIQRDRFSTSGEMNGLVQCCKLLFAPVYVLLCAVEVLLAVLLYGIPFVMFVVVFVRGISIALLSVKRRIQQYSRMSNIVIRFIIGNPLNSICMVLLVTAVLILFSYASIIILIAGFTHVFSVAVVSLIAVIMFPSTGFANLFFIIMCVFHTLRLIRHFGDGYTSLLSGAVRISQTLDSQECHVEAFDNILVIYNVKVQQNVKSLRINNRTIHVEPYILRSLCAGTQDTPLTKVKYNQYTYGIPKDLFDFLIQKHLPIHQQIFKLFLRLILIATLMGSTIAVITKFQFRSKSEISEMMHVMFVLTIGTFPGLLDKALMKGSETVRKQIEQRRLKRLIVAYWLGQVKNM